MSGFEFEYPQYEFAPALSPEATRSYYASLMLAYQVRIAEVEENDLLISPEELKAWSTLIEVADHDTLEKMEISPERLLQSMDAQLDRFHARNPTN